jgi:hypothetical protein
MKRELFVNSGDSEEKEVFYYTTSGDQEFFDEYQLPRVSNLSDKTYAKKTKNKEGVERFFIRLALNNKLYNPTSKLGMERTKSFLDNVVREDRKFKSVNKKTFDLYVSFLKTKNSSYYLNAEREDI